MSRPSTAPKYSNGAPQPSGRQLNGSIDTKANSRFALINPNAFSNPSAPRIQQQPSADNRIPIPRMPSHPRIASREDGSQKTNRQPADQDLAALSKNTSVLHPVALSQPRPQTSVAQQPTVWRSLVHGEVAKHVEVTSKSDENEIALEFASNEWPSQPIAKQPAMLPEFEAPEQAFGQPNVRIETGSPIINSNVPIADSLPEYADTALHLPSVPRLFFPSAAQSGACPELIHSYQGRSQLSAGQRQGNNFDMTPLPDGFQPWWAKNSSTAMGIKPSQLPVTLNALIVRALENSPHIQVAASAPHIRQAQLLEQSAQFDWVAFLESQYDDQNDPIGNQLTTGNNDDRFTQQQWSARGGLRRRNAQGGELEVSQQLGTLDNNSRFLDPRHQGNARLQLNYRHPLLRGRGRAVNESLIVLADIDLQQTSDDLLTEIQTHLAELTSTYWELVRARAELLQRQKLLVAAEKILEQLVGRSAVDALDRQIFRAKAAVANRKAEIARSVTSIKNAESRIRLLVNDPQIVNGASVELVPQDLPNPELLPIELSDAISTALHHRPDVSKAIRDVRASSVRVGVARNDVLPRLDMIVGSYVAGLDGSADFLNSWVQQFRDGRPGFNVGIEFEVPLGNRAAIARQERRQWEFNRSMHQFKAIVETGLTEVEIAVREVQTAYQEMQGRYQAMVAASNETDFLADRWETLPDMDDSVTLLLENLLDSQERLADEEAAFAKAQFDYAVATIQLKQSVGTLFQID